MEAFDRIPHNPAVMGGKACIRGMRVTVGMIVSQLAAGQTVAELLEDFLYLERKTFCSPCATELLSQGSSEGPRRGPVSDRG